MAKKKVPYIRQKAQSKKQKAKSEFLDFAFRLQSAGFPVGRAIASDLISAGYGDLTTVPQDQFYKDKYEQTQIAKGGRKPKPEIERKTERALKQFENGIQTSDWKIPRDKIFDHTPEFFAWINSINKGFEHKIFYKPFTLYCSQSESWNRDEANFYSMTSTEQKERWLAKEMQRWDDNSLYWLNRLWSYKDAASTSGFTKYTAYEAQKVICFLIDSGYNLFIAKARQIYFTTTMFAIALKRSIMRRSHLTMIVTADINKSKATFEDKVKAPYFAMPFYSRPLEPTRKGETWLRFFGGDDDPGSSRLEIYPDAPTVINANSPDFALIDEIAIMNTLSDMIANWEPTATQLNPVTGKREPKGQMVAWGSSWREKNEVLNPDFELKLKAYIDQWESKNWWRNPIPVILNCFARQGYTKQEYDLDKQKAYSVKGNNRERERIIFHMNNPIGLEDMFMTSADTMIPFDIIVGHEKRIKFPPPEQKFVQFDGKKLDTPYQWGKFEPVFDRSQKMENDYSNDVPYKVIGARFIPLDEFSDHACIKMYRPPAMDSNGKLMYKQRYWQGTDPIANSSGQSYMSSDIFDGLNKTDACSFYYRIANHRWCFLQTLLMGIYYDPNIMHLVESNMGENFFDFIDKLGYNRTVVFNAALPPILQTSSGNIKGINNKGNTKQFIHSYLAEFIELYGNNLWIDDFWSELKGYINKPLASNVNSFKPQKYAHDDKIDSTAFAYICYKTFEFKKPINIVEQRNEPRKTIYVNTYDENYRLVRQAIPEPREETIVE